MPPRLRCVLRRSIIELCGADHRDDPALLAAWLSNKTPETIAGVDATHRRRPISSPSKRGALAAVGAVTDAGEILLNYVSPDARFRGVSRALLAALETRAWERGATRLHADQHGNGAAVLSRTRIRGDRRASQKIRDGLRLSDVQEIGRRRTCRVGPPRCRGGRSWTFPFRAPTPSPLAP